MVNRLSLDGSKHPNFIGCWTLENASICDDLIEFFERNEQLQKPGRVGDGGFRKTVKNSTDIAIAPCDLKDEKFRVASIYIEQLQICYLDYLEQWEFLKSFRPRIHIGQFNIQKYCEGGHFAKLHSERTSLSLLHRTLVWMTYLNDVPDGGETEFHDVWFENQT
jgi:hypothetical protein